MRKKLLLCATAALAFSASTAAHAVTVYSDLNAWKSAVGTFNRDTDYGSTFSDIGSLTLDDGTQLGFGSSLNVRTIGSGWATWSGGYTGQVLYSNGVTSVTSTISPTGGFGLFVEPNPFSTFLFTLDLSDGSSVQGNYSGSAGAGFLGFAGGGITNFSISSDTDFAIGDFYTASGAVPEPATWAMMLIGFGAVGGAMRRRQKMTVRYA